MQEHFDEKVSIVSEQDADNHFIKKVDNFVSTSKETVKNKV